MYFSSGHGDMAVANAIGSNVFDILVCLGIPWFLETAIVDPGSYVAVRSKGKFPPNIQMSNRTLPLI
jgi:Ca2+/Na+ antiporter